MTPQQQNKPGQLVLVTGPSGAGRTTAIKTLEDLDFETIDNLPLRFWPRLLDGPPSARPLALGVDTRNRDFSVAALQEHLNDLANRPEFDLSLLYLDCRSDVLVRRFSETRRRHPLTPDEDTESGINRELELLAPIRAQADVLIDTSDLNVHQARAEIERNYARDASQTLSVTVMSFSYKRGLPRGADMVFDCRFLKNPHWDPVLRPQNGTSASVQDHVRSDARFDGFFDRVLDLTRLLLPAFVAEGKSHLTLAFGCSGGKHRSVTLAETLAKALAEDAQPVSIRHRDLEKPRNG